MKIVSKWLNVDARFKLRKKKMKPFMGVFYKDYDRYPGIAESPDTMQENQAFGEHGCNPDIRENSYKMTTI